MNNILIEELSSPGCHNCAAFKKMWGEIESEWPNVTLKELSILDPEGQTMAQKYQILASPGIVINGELFATGGINKEDFLKRLTELSG